jgi:hypothetical protein
LGRLGGLRQQGRRFARFFSHGLKPVASTAILLRRIEVDGAVAGKRKMQTRGPSFRSGSQQKKQPQVFRWCEKPLLRMTFVS